MNNQFDDAIDQLKARIAEMELEAVDLKRAVNSLCKTSGKPAFYADSELGPKGFSGLGSLKPSQFYGKTPTVAAREYLDMRSEAVDLEEILEALRRGGFDFEAQGWKNDVMHLKNLSISLGKNTNIFHRLPNGMMGLTKWYPNVKARRAGRETEKADTTTPNDDEALNDEASAPTEDDLRDAMADAAEA